MTGSKHREHIDRIGPGEPFFFSCHHQVGCFTDCCRDLELALTPYDVLQLRRATGLVSADLLETYIIVEQNTEDVFPRFYLTMVDDGRASCAFVGREGCSVYEYRPGACRAYPLGRAVIRNNGSLKDFHILLHEPHCRGFGEQTVQTVGSFSRSQGLEPYNRFNDMLTSITQHEKIRQGLRLSDDQVQTYTLALYDIDTFRSRLEKGAIPGAKDVPGIVFSDDEALLCYGMEWAERKIFFSAS